MKHRSLVGLLLVLVSVGACGSSGDKGATAGPEDAAEARKEAGCEEVDPALLAKIGQGLKGRTLRNGYAVRSDDYSKVWFVGAEMVEVPGERIGLWATNDLAPQGHGVVYSVNTPAKENSDWGPGPSGMSAGDDGGAEAWACASGRADETASG